MDPDYSDDLSPPDESMDDLLNAFGQGLTGEHMHTRWMRLALVHPEEELAAGAARIGAWLASL